MSYLFENLGFLSENKNELEKQDKLVASIWRIVSAKNHAKVNNIKAMMCAIQNFHVDWYLNREDLPLDKKKIGKIVSNSIHFTSDEITHLTKKYLQLYKNRQNQFQDNLKSHHYTKSCVKGVIPKAPKFKPEVSLKNQKLWKDQLKR